MNEELLNPFELLKNYIDQNNPWGEWNNDKTCQRLLQNFIAEKNYGVKVKFALDAIRELIKHSGKKDIPDSLLEVYKIETTIRELIPSARDHVVHSLNTYLLGLWLQSKLELPIDDFMFQWMLSALFHDIGYPIELANKLAYKSVCEPLDKVRNQLGVRKRKKYKIRMTYPSLGRLCSSPDRTGERSTNALHFIQECFNIWGITLRAENYYRKTAERGNVNHGIVSALMLMSYVDLYYQKENPQRVAQCDKETSDGRVAMWGQDVFLDYVIPPVAAIYLHSVGGDEFGGNKITRRFAPLAYLLRLADTLQDWGRPSGNNPIGYPDTAYRIGFENYKIQYQCPNDQGRETFLNRERAAKDDLSALDSLDDINIVGI